MTPAVRLERVTKEYEEGGEARRVLVQASAEIAVGEVVAVVGRSGSGKTTLLNLLAGIDRPTSGEVFVGDECLTRMSARDRALLRRRRVGLVFQFFNLIPTLTVRENVQLPVELGGLGTGVARSRALALLAEVGLADRADEFPERLSGGEQQRVAIARAIVHEPGLLLADEPTGNLDDTTGAAVMALLESVTRGTGRTLVLVTHSASVASRADRVLRIEAGALVETAAETGHSQPWLRVER